MSGAASIDQLVDHFFRHQSGNLVAVLTRVFGLHNLETVEDVVQSALVQALESWKIQGVPEDPAAWMYRAGLESMLGLRRRGTTFSIDPCVPSSWREYEIVWRYRGTRYEITVANPEGKSGRVAAAEIDGVAVDPRAIPLVEDGGVRRLRILIGTPSAVLASK